MPANGQYAVTAVEHRTSGDKELWHVMLERTDGYRRTHVFPADTFLWRSIEYGIDPAAFDTLLDIILHEPYIDDPTDPANHATDPAAKAGLVVAGRPVVDEIFGQVRAAETAVPVWLYNTSDTTAAREAHLQRIAEVKRGKATVMWQPSPSDPVEVMRSHHADVLMLIDQVDEVRAVYDAMQTHISETKQVALAAEANPIMVRHSTFEQHPERLATGGQR